MAVSSNYLVSNHHQAAVCSIISLNVLVQCPWVIKLFHIVLDSNPGKSNPRPAVGCTVKIQMYEVSVCLFLALFTNMLSARGDSSLYSTYPYRVTLHICMFILTFTHSGSGSSRGCTLFPGNCAKRRLNKKTGGRIKLYFQTLSAVYTWRSFMFAAVKAQLIRCCTSLVEFSLYMNLNLQFHHCHFVFLVNILMANLVFHFLRIN